MTTHLDKAVHGIALAMQRGAGDNAYYVFDDGVIEISEFIRRILAAAGLQGSGQEHSAKGGLDRRVGA